MILKQKWLIAGVAMLAAGVLAGSAAFAAAGDGTGPLQRGTAAQANLTDGEKEVLQQLQDLRASYQEKLKAEAQALVDKAVADGKITQEQAGRFSNFATGPKIGARPGFAPGPGPMMGPGRPGGRGMAPGIQGKGFGPGARGKMAGPATPEEMKARLDAAVAAGKLTQEQADQMLQHWTEHQALRLQKAPATNN